MPAFRRRGIVATQGCFDGRDSRDRFMKKFPALVLAVTAMWAPKIAAQTAGAQVFFSNKAVNAPVYDSTGVKLAGANYAAELFFGAAGSDPSSFVGLDSSISPFYAVAAKTKAGLWNGGTLNKNFPSSVAQGVAISVQVRVWDGSLFTTWAGYAAEAADVVDNPARLPLGTSFQGGTSSVFSFTPPTDAGLLTPGSANLTGLQSFSLNLIGPPCTGCPEPSAVSLAIVGVCAVIWFRRSS
jgi:hypothetical protein